MPVDALELAAKITHPVSAAIFAAVLALIALLTLTKGDKVIPKVAWFFAAVILLLGISPLLANTYLDSQDIYRVRIEVFTAARQAQHDAEITSSAGGELKKTDAGWEFTLPRQEKPQNGQVTFRAAVKDAFLAGESTLKLESNYFPQATIQIAPLPLVNVRGMVEDEKGRPVEAARVWISGYDETAVTGPTGGFSLPAHAADGQQISLVVQKGALTARTTAFAGRTAEIVLRKP